MIGVSFEPQITGTERDSRRNLELRSVMNMKETSDSVFSHILPILEEKQRPQNRLLLTILNVVCVNADVAPTTGFLFFRFSFVLLHYFHSK